MIGPDTRIYEANKEEEDEEEEEDEADDDDDDDAHLWSLDDSGAFWVQAELALLPVALGLSVAS